MNIIDILQSFEQPATVAGGIISALVSYGPLIWGKVAAKCGKSHISFRIKINLSMAGLLIASLLAIIYTSEIAIGIFFAVAVASISVTRGATHAIHAAGIHSVSEKIEKDFNYAKSLRACHNSIAFCGIGASKLTELPEFEQAIARCTRHGRQTVRLLLCRPDNSVLKEAERDANVRENTYSRKVKASLQKIKMLQNAHNIEVKFYKMEEHRDFPYFRIMIIDGKICAVSYNAIGKGDGRSLPQIIFQKPKTEDYKNFYYIFEEFFERTWDDAEKWNFKRYLDDDQSP